MRKNEYSVPKAVYYQCIWLIKDIDRLRKLEAVSNYATRDDELVFCDQGCRGARQSKMEA